MDYEFVFEAILWYSETLIIHFKSFCDLTLFFFACHLSSTFRLHLSSAQRRRKIPKVENFVQKIDVAAWWVEGKCSSRFYVNFPEIFRIGSEERKIKQICSSDTIAYLNPIEGNENEMVLFYFISTTFQKERKIVYRCESTQEKKL